MGEPHGIISHVSQPNIYTYTNTPLTPTHPLHTQRERGREEKEKERKEEEERRKGVGKLNQGHRSHY